MTGLQMIIGNVLGASLIGLVAWFVGRSGRYARAAHLLWISFFIKLIVPPLILFPVFVPDTWLPDGLIKQGGVAAASLPAAAASHSPIDSTLTQTPNARLTVQPKPTRWITPVMVVAFICLSGTAWILGRDLLRFLRFHKLLQNEGSLDERASAAVAALAQSEPRAVPAVLRLPIRVSPMLFGFGHRPVIVCPDALWSNLSENERQSFLAHETAHFCRRDHWVRWLEWVVSAIYWWFPGVYIARCQLERNEEICCDAWVIDRLNQPPRTYAEALLKVVDFISDQRVGMPLMASGMLPTASLEERLRLVMAGRSHSTTPVLMRAMILLTGTALITLNPVFTAVAIPEVAAATTDVPVATVVPSAMPMPGPGPQPIKIPPADLPAQPVGYWNRQPRAQWVDFSLSLPGASITASVDDGVTVVLPSVADDTGNTRPGNREALQFSSSEFRAIVDIPTTRRIVIGTQDGSVRMWDLEAGMPVSLLGSHTGDVTSLAYHETGGLVSTDSTGAAIRWDLQSGEILSTAIVADRPVQSARFSQDGRTLAVLSGVWSHVSEPQSVTFVDSQTFEAHSSIVLPNHVAVIVASTDDEWLSIDWTGNVRWLSDNTSAGRIAKQDVSAMVLAQDAGVPR